MTISTSDKLNQSITLIERLEQNNINWVKNGNFVCLMHQPSGVTLTIDNTISKEPAYRNYAITRLLQKVRIGN